MELGHCQLPTRNQSRNPCMEKNQCSLTWPGRADRQNKSRAVDGVMDRSRATPDPDPSWVLGTGNTDQDEQREGQRGRANCCWYLPSTGGILRPDCWNWFFPSPFSIKKSWKYLYLRIYKHSSCSAPCPQFPAHTESIQVFYLPINCIIFAYNAIQGIRD